jgi:hypothetical protein
MIAGDGQNPPAGSDCSKKRVAPRSSCNGEGDVQGVKPWRGLIGLSGAAALAFGASAATPAASAGGTLIWAMPAEMGLDRTSRAAG